MSPPRKSFKKVNLGGIIFLSEAEYSFKLKKKIVPLKLEEGYEPDGWLGFIAGANLYYEFSGYRPYDEELQRLVHVLTKMKQEFVSQQTVS